MKWEQTFVAYSDCGKYRIEVDESGLSSGTSWDWTLYSNDEDEWIYLDECHEPLASVGEAKADAVSVLCDYLASDKKREEERSPVSGQHVLNHIAEHARLFFGHNVRISNTEDAPLLVPTGHPCCGATSVEHMSDCPVLHTKLNEQFSEFLRTGDHSGLQKILESDVKFEVIATNPAHQEQADAATKIVNHLAASKGDFWAPPRAVTETGPLDEFVCGPRCSMCHNPADWDEPCKNCDLHKCGDGLRRRPRFKAVAVNEDEFSCPELEENVQAEIDPKQLADMRPLIAEGKSIAGRWELAKALIAAPEITYSKEAMDELLNPAEKKSGYDQILALIKNESKDIEL